MYNEKDDLLARLFSLTARGIKKGLEGMELLSVFYNHPEKALKVVHIAGTNGKGSTSSMIASILMESGFKVGLYTSPHIYKFNERIQINGILISDEEINHYLPDLLNHAESQQFSFFEITTMLAFLYFRDKQVDFAIIETGLGGRLDSTNIITPLISVITQIDIDHTEYLGNTIEQIAFEKAGIIKPNLPVVIAKNNEIACSILRNYAQKCNSEIFDNNKYEVIYNKIDENLNVHGHISCFDDKINEIQDFTIGLTGKHQLINAQNALSTIGILKKYYNYEISNQQIIDGLKNVKKNTNFKARIEIIHHNPPILIDVSHNPNGIKALRETIESSNLNKFKWNILFSALNDKDYISMLENLSCISNIVNIVELKVERAAKLTDLIKASIDKFQEVNSSENTEELIKTLLLKNEPLLVVGSFHLIEQFMEVINRFK